VRRIRYSTRGTGGGPLLRRARSSPTRTGTALLVRGAGRGIRPRRPGAAAPRADRPRRGRRRGSRRHAAVARTARGRRGLLPLELGDHRQLELSLPVYDALYAWCRHEVEAARRPDAARAIGPSRLPPGDKRARPRRRLRAQAAPLRRAHRAGPGRRDRLRGAAAPHSLPDLRASPGADRRSR